MVAYIFTDIAYYIFSMVKKRSEIFRTCPNYIIQVRLIIINVFFFMFYVFLIMYMYWLRSRFWYLYIDNFSHNPCKNDVHKSSILSYHFKNLFMISNDFHSIISRDGPGIRICGYLHRKLASASTLVVVLMRMYDT